MLFDVEERNEEGSSKILREEATLILFSLSLFFFQAVNTDLSVDRRIQVNVAMLIRKGRRTELAGSLYHVICSSG